MSYAHVMEFSFPLCVHLCVYIHIHRHMYVWSHDVKYICYCRPQSKVLKVTASIHTNSNSITPLDYTQRAQNNSIYLITLLI